jgi:hypothetical protein
MRISVLGFIGRLPLAGVTAHFLQYLLGLRTLGHDVFYIDDSGGRPFDPIHNAKTMDASYTIEYLTRHLERFAFADRWTYKDPSGNYMGMSKERTHEVLRTSDLLINVSGGNVLCEEHLRVPKRILIDADPPFLQIFAADGHQNVIDFLKQHTTLFTFAENIGKPSCRIPSAGCTWQTTRQPVDLDLWPYVFSPNAPTLTTIMNWDTGRGHIEFRGEVYGEKGVEFMKFADLPRYTSQLLDIGMAHPPASQDQLRARGWRLHDPFPPTRDLWTYQEYLFNSRGEFSVAKNAYVRSWSGWFSERSTCYMACGKPVILQDTGFSEWLPTGDGVFAFKTMEEAVEAIAQMNRAYQHHCKAARRLVEEYFDSDRVLRDLLEKSLCA